MTLHYPDKVMDRLQLLWGQGFMSPGGPDEVRAIVARLDLRGRRVLDIGCGTGGPALVLAGEMGAQVVAVDVEPQVLDRGKDHAAAAGLSDRIDFRLIEPGPLPFADAAFDVVFSKDALIHVPDKQALYREVLRVLKPGGRFAASDWLCSEDAMADPNFQAFVRDEMDFAMATAAQTLAAMRRAGFSDVAATDRNAWYARLCASELREIEGPLREAAIAISGADSYASWLAFRRIMAAAAGSGSLRPTHLFGCRPG